MRRIATASWLLSLVIIPGHPASAAVRYYDISGTTAPAENACPVWVLDAQDDCSYDSSNSGAAQWIGPVFSAGYYAPGAAPSIFTSPAVTVPVAAPEPVLPTGGKTGIPISRGFISIDDAGTPEGTDDVIRGTLEFGGFQRNVGTGPLTRHLESFERIIHRIVTASSNVSSATANGAGGFDYVVGASDGSPASASALSGSTTADGGFADSFPSEVASQSSADADDTAYWSAPGPNGIARLEGNSAIEGSATVSTVWGYVCDAGTGIASCVTTDVNWDGDARARFDNVLLTLSTDSSGNITSATAFLVNEFSLSASIAGDDSWSATTLSFTGVEDPLPDAFDDRRILVNGLDNAIFANPLENDVPGLAPVTVSIVEPFATHGTAVVLTGNLVNTVQYTPTNTTFEGIDTITYQITDNNGDTATGTVAVLLTDPVTCQDDSASAARNGDVTVQVLANDAGFDIPPIAVSIATPPGQGTATVNPDNSITFTAPSDAGGIFNVDYIVEDGSGEGAQCRLSIDVDDLPTADADSFDVENGVTTPLNVLENDDGISETPITITITSMPSHGSALVVPAGSFPAFIRYTSDAGYEGPDSLTYRVADASGDVSNEATVTITVADSTPVAVADAQTVEDGVQARVNVVTNDTSRVDIPLTITITTPPTQGTATVVPGTANSLPAVNYTSNAGFAGTDTFGYTLTDDDGDVSNEATVTMTVQDSAPVALNDTFNGDSRAVLPLNVLLNDTGLTDQPLTIEITQQPSLGTATVLAPSSTTNNRPSIGYASDAGATGTDTLQYRVTDSDGDISAVATVTVNVANVTPVAVDDTATVENNVSVIISVLTNDTGRSNLPVTIQVIERPVNGQLTINAVPPPGLSNVTYRSNASFTGTDTFRYRFRDGDDQQSNEAIVTITVNDTVPVANADTANGDARVATAIDVLANDSGIGVDGPMTIEITGQPTNGTAALVTVTAGGGRPGISYASNAGFGGTDTIRYRITAADGDVSNETTVTLSVTDHTPVAVNDSGADPNVLPGESNGFVIERLETPVDVLRNDTGRENRPNTITITQQPAHGTAEVDLDAIEFLGRPGILYRSDEGYTGPDQFRYTVTDGDDQVSNEATVTFDVVSLVTARSDGDPLPVPTSRNTSVVVDVLANDGGLAFGPIEIEITGTLNGTATVNADNTVTFVPAANFTGQWSSPVCPPQSCLAGGGAYFTYAVTDALGQRSETAAFIDVFAPPVNDQGGSSSLDKGLIGLLLMGGALRGLRRGAR